MRGLAGLVRVGMSSVDGRGCGRGRDQDDLGWNRDQDGHRRARRTAHSHPVEGCGFAGSRGAAQVVEIVEAAGAVAVAAVGGGTARCARAGGRD